MVGISYPDSAEAFDIQPVSRDDGDILTELYENSPDGGDIGFAPQFKIDPYVAYDSMYPERPTKGVLAIAPDGSPAGAGFVNLIQARAGGELRPAAYLSGLAVHEEYRGQGLAKRLASERITLAEREHDSDAVTFANIQSGNEPSRAVAKSWADGFHYRTASRVFQPTDERPDEQTYTVRPVRETEHQAVVDRSNEFYESAELYDPYTVESLRARLRHAPAGESVADYLVAVVDGNLVAGALVMNVHKLMWAAIDELPPEMEQAEQLPPSIPESRELRQTAIANLWFEEDHEGAVEAIIDEVRADPASGNRIGFGFDPDGPLADVASDGENFTEMSIAMRGLDSPVEDAFVGRRQ